MSRKGLLLVLAGTLALLFATANVVILVRQNRADARFVPRGRLNLQEPSTLHAYRPPLLATSNRVLRVAIAPVISPERSLPIYQTFVEYLAEQVDKEPVLLQRDTYAQVNNLVRYGRCDLALVCTYPFVRGQREFGMEALVVPQIAGAITYHSLIVVPASSPARSLLDLRGTRFASADIMSNSGWLYPLVWLTERGEDVDSFFAEHVITGSHDRSVQAVASGYVDGAAIDSLVYEQMVAEDGSLARRTKVIQKSPPFGMPPVVVSPHTSPALKSQLRAVLLEMHQDERGMDILKRLGIDRFVVPNDDLYDSVREAAKVLEANW